MAQRRKCKYENSLLFPWRCPQPLRGAWAVRWGGARGWAGLGRGWGVRSGGGGGLSPCHAPWCHRLWLFLHWGWGGCCLSVSVSEWGERGGIQALCLTVAPLFLFSQKSLQRTREKYIKKDFSFLCKPMLRVLFCFVTYAQHTHTQHTNANKHTHTDIQTRLYIIF